MLVGAGLREPVEDLAQTFGKEHDVRIEADYAGGEVLLSRLKLARKGEVYIPGDRHYVDQADQAELVLGRQPVCYFVPTILVRKGNPKGIRGLNDLVKPEVRLGLGDAKACAIGRQSKRLFEKNGLAWAEVEKNLKFQSLTVNELGMQIQTGSLDAVIVWDAVAKQYAAHGEEAPIPKEQNLISTVEAAVLKCARDRELAEKFIEFARSARGQEILAKHGYRTAPPE